METGNISRCDNCDKEIGIEDNDTYIETGLCLKCYQNYLRDTRPNHPNDPCFA